MNLAIDAGNTRIKWGVHDGQAWVTRGAVPLGEWAALGQAWQTGRPIRQAIVCNVAGPVVAQQLAGLLAPVTGQVEWLRSTACLAGVQNRYDQPESLGPDRLAALVGARLRWRTPCVVATCGTALTVDALTSQGEFLGGLIVPGLTLMQQSLRSGTAGLDAPQGTYQVFPANTANAMATGAIFAACGAIERMAGQLARHESQPVQVVLSGGGAGQLAPHVQLPFVHIETLVLDGLIRILNA